MVDKQAKQGRLYLKKGTVVDVHPGGLCDVSMDEGRETVTVRPLARPPPLVAFLPACPSQRSSRLNPSPRPVREPWHAHGTG